MIRVHLELRNGLFVLTALACTLLLAPLLVFGAQATFEVSVSGPEASGDPDGRGQATVTMNAETNQVDVRLSYSNIAAPTAVHIRRGPTGLDGNVVMPIVIESDEGGMLVGRRRSAKPNIVETILASPGEYYLVILNGEYPVGALRGPLRSARADEG